MPRGVKGSGPPRKRAPAKPKANQPQDARKAPAVFASADKPLGSVDIDSLCGDELRAYARRAGVYHEDVDNLTEDRLRQNTKLVIASHFELIEELG